MAVTIQLRRDTAANWTAANTLLAQGEPGYELDTGKLKIGDGVTHWNSLLYFAGGGSGITQRHLTSNYVMLAADNSAYFDNFGAITEVDVTLPAAPATAQLNAFIVVEAQTLKIVAPAGVTIGIGTAVSALGGNIASNLPGSSVTMYALSSTQWVSTGVTGSWDVN